MFILVFTQFILLMFLNTYLQRNSIVSKENKEMVNKYMVDILVTHILSYRRQILDKYIIYISPRDVKKKYSKK